MMETFSGLHAPGDISAWDKITHADMNTHMQIRI